MYVYLLHVGQIIISKLTTYKNENPMKLKGSITDLNYICFFEL